VQEGILNTLRESIPVEAILKAYMDETVEEDVIEEVKEEVVHEPIFAKNEPPVSSAVSFNNIDYVKTTDGIEQINAPKNVDYLEEQNRRRMAEQSNTEDDKDDHVQLHISNQEYNINSGEIENLEDTLPKLMEDEIEFEVLE
jgi:hypothetical protein